jgi:hypothetical protein
MGDDQETPGKHEDDRDGHGHPQPDKWEIFETDE